MKPGERSHSAARTFFLNEQHELARGEKSGGGPPTKFAIDWVQKGATLSAALTASRNAILASRDPLRDRRYFLVATPSASVPKVSKDVKRAPQGILSETPHYGGEHSRVFRRLGMDLIDVSDEGVATVHATTDRFNRLLATASALEKQGLQERGRWATVDRFDPVPATHRMDSAWFGSLHLSTAADVVIEMQPLLSRAEVEEVIGLVARMLRRELGEALVSTGTDFSGRRWFRGKASKTTLKEISESFYSIQSLHPPLRTGLAAPNARAKTPAVAARVRSSVPDIAALPTVAVVDTGVPAGHNELAPYRRGAYMHPDAPAPHAGDHGSFVASRIVFGDLDFSANEHARPAGRCRFVDAMVAQGRDEIEDKAVAPALEAIVAIYPDVRVFNLSFGERRPLSAYDPIQQQERLRLVQDLDNFVFARDVIVVVAAGNSMPGIIPNAQYPHHVDEPEWQLGAWPSGFNSLACGGTVEVLHPDGMVKSVGWPSPFSRIGPGVAASPKPDFGAHGGNLADDWSWRGSMGVWGSTATGAWEDRCGTSGSAPLLAREAAFALHTLQRFCDSGARPFAVAVKAFLALTAQRVTLPPPIRALADRTIGRGTASAARLSSPSGNSAVFLWQGVIDGPDDLVRVQLPIPGAWLAQAARPRLRLVVSWDPPVNAAVRQVWGCRQVEARLRASSEGRALHASHGAHPSYPLLDKTYDLSKEKLAKLESRPDDDMWIVELSYKQIAEYYTGITFAQQQRVAFAAELVDDAEQPVSPQAAVQAIPAAASMTRLALPAARVSVPIIVRTS
jgi:hypothetical protein